MRQEVQVLLSRLIEAYRGKHEFSYEDLRAEFQRIGGTPQEWSTLRDLLVANYREDTITAPGWNERAELLRLLQGPDQAQRNEVISWVQKRMEPADTSEGEQH